MKQLKVYLMYVLVAGQQVLTAFFLSMQKIMDLKLLIFHSKVMSIV
ncbi:hypothetical protein vBEcoMphAPEC6_gp261c [Escherichia phage vB_EcoM_phAPEC6]|nr:hypothetical protein vBEcoMphAPEC6_gp261c [Escherichia phage vB_EcoM_phAPEC6]